MTAPIPFRVGDRIELRRPHPCGGRTWIVDRLGADLGIRCERCGHHVLVERRRVEQRLLRVLDQDPEPAAPPGKPPA